jgi:c-di-GMP-binding flagellar brake protein YcgR
MLSQAVQAQSESMSHERRTSSRYSVEARLRARVRCSGEARTVHGQGSDISAGGMAVYLPYELEVGETVELEFTLPYASEPLKVLAVVRSRRSYQYGVEFTNLSAGATAAIKRACASLALVQ